MLQQKIANLLASFTDPYSGHSLADLKVVPQITLTDQIISINLKLGYPIEKIKEKWCTLLQNYLQAYDINAALLQIHLDTHIHTHTGKAGLKALPNIKNIIAVASGKGGVGKSLVAHHIALALQRAGAKVGLLDVDIYGPSQPLLLGTQGSKPKIENNLFIPITVNGIQTMSIGYLVEAQAALVWRGPMIAKAMEQMLTQTQWQQIDYLILDMPPGTGDIQLSLCQKVPLSGAVMITTPQEVACLDVRRACSMFTKMNVSLLGVIENMSHYTCQQCGHSEAIFGAGGGKQLAQEFNIPFLGQLPLQQTFREMTDSAHANAFLENNKNMADHLLDIALKLVANLTLQRSDYSHKFPKIVVQ